MASYSNSNPSNVTSDASTFDPSVENAKGQGASHATTSSVPQGVQERVPKSVEDKLPDSVHDTNSNKDTGKVSHATGDSKVPHALQEAVPAKVEKILPNSIHDTRGADI